MPNNTIQRALPALTQRGRSSRFPTGPAATIPRPAGYPGSSTASASAATPPAFGSGAFSKNSAAAGSPPVDM